MPILPITKPRVSRCGFTLIELLVVISIIALLIGILLPSLGQAKLSAMKVKCQANCKGITAAAHSYAADHSGKCMPDDRFPAWELEDGAKVVKDNISGNFEAVPTNEEELKLSWFGQIENNYLSGERSAVDCPVIDDHRKSGYDDSTGLHLWYTDYSLNRFGFNRSLDTAEEPVQNVMFAEPDMPRATYIANSQYIVAFYMWWGENRGRMDLEQLKAGSLSYGFVDGHASRVPIKDVKIPFLEEMPGLALSCGNPPTRGNPGMNLLWWSSSDVKPGQWNSPILPIPNEKVEGVDSN